MLYTPSNQIRPLIAAIVDSYSREKYLDSSPWIIAELRKMGAQVRTFHLTDERLAPKLLGFSPDLIWPMGLGPYAEDGRLQGFIETLLPGTPYVGSGVAASALGMDKEYFQAMCQTLDIAVAKSVCYTTFLHPHGRSCRVSKPGDALFLTKEGQPFYLTLVEHLGTPLLVKPLHGGASLDVAVVRSAEEFEAAFHNASRSGPALVQAYIAGVEYSICLLETVSPLPICEVWHEAIHDTQSKVDGASERIPALLDPDIAAHLDAQARALHELLDCHGPCRFDVKINPEGRPVFLEVNTNPGLIPSVSIFPKVCEVAGLDYQTLIRKILSTGLLPRRRETRRLSAAEAAPFPVAFRSRLPNLPAELQPPVYQALAAEAHEALVVATIHHACED